MQRGYSEGTERVVRMQWGYGEAEDAVKVGWGGGGVAVDVR